MDTGADSSSDFIAYPTNRVVGTMPDAESADRAVEALLQVGFGREAIDLLQGERDLGRLDPTGASHGVVAQFQRAVLRTASGAEEFAHLRHHVDDIRAGRIVLMVHSPRREQRMLAADILNAHGAAFVGFYGRWAWQGLTPGAEAGGPGPSGQPEQIALLFAQAWNARDPEGIAGLFEEDAEFVNVTGLWWHDRAAIREAHAYGLARIFNNSTLTVNETRVRQLSAEIAVVQARMTLTGQSPVGDVREPGPRTTVFTFVVRLTSDGWRCVSAHNTDVVPGMETNVAVDGQLRSANYRSGRAT